MNGFVDVKCDACNAKAQKRITFPSGLDLILCSHHTNRYVPKMDAAVTVADLNPIETPVPVS